MVAKRQLLKQVAFTLMIIVLYRIGTTIPLPGVDVALLDATIDDLDRNGFLQVLDLFAGGAAASTSVLAVGIVPYVTASLAFQLLNGVVPSLRELSKQGPSGQRKLASITRIFAVMFALAQAVIIVRTLDNSTLGGMLPIDLLPREGLLYKGIAVATLTAGFLVLLWFADLIGKHGTGNGMSVLLLVSVLANVVAQGRSVLAEAGIAGAVVLSVVILGALTAIVTLSQVERRIEVATSKQARTQRGRVNSYIPLKLLQAGVAPAIFAGAILGLITGAVALLSDENPIRIWTESMLRSGGPGYLLLLTGLVVFFTYFYTAVQFNTLEISDDLAKRGMFVVGVRPGEDTMHRLAWVLARIAVAAGIILAVVAALPVLVQQYTQVTNVPLLGVTLLIATSVATDTMRQVRARQSLYDYDSIISGDDEEELHPLVRAA